MRIMFVDDEPRILQAIRRIMLPFADNWEMVFAGSGSEALETLKQESIDMIVTDMRMPGMDGAALLQEIQVSFPDVVRIVLTGYAGLEAALKAVPVTHQFISKPCKPETLENIMDRTSSLREMLGNEEIRRVVGAIETLPSEQGVYLELKKALIEGRSNSENIARIICKDLAMSAKILQLANSEFFRQAATISTIEDGVIRLGPRTIEDLALNIGAFRNEKLREIPPEFSLKAANKHATHTARLAKQLLGNSESGDAAFMAGMLHDIGKLILANAFPERYEATITYSVENNIPLFKAELEMLSTNHMEIGAYLMGLWGLPSSITDAIARHDEPSWAMETDEFGVPDAVYIANCLTCGGTIDADYLAYMKLEDQVDNWREMASALKRHDRE